MQKWNIEVKPWADAGWSLALRPDGLPYVYEYQMDAEAVAKALYPNGSWRVVPATNVWDGR